MINAAYFYVRNALQTDFRRFGKYVILEVSTFLFEYIFIVFRPNQYFFTVYDSLLNVEGADEKRLFYLPSLSAR